MRRAPFPHQIRGMELLRESLRTGHRRPMLCSPTGSGKTKLASMVVEGALAKGRRVTFVVPAISLIDQTVAAFHAEGIRNIGVIQAKHPMTDWSKPVQVASVQTLQNRSSKPESDIVVRDEAHRLFDFDRHWMADPAWSKVPFIGLSATPWAKGLGKHFDDLLIVTTTQDLIGNGFLSRFRVFAPTHPDLSGVKTLAGDYREDQLAEVMSPLVADVVSTWVQRGENRPTLCFAVDRAHAKKLQIEFLAAGVAADYIDAYTDLDERKAVESRLVRGQTRVVCNVGVLTTGIDWDIRCLILARPTKSEMLFVQIIGRGLRTAPGKTDCIILDHSDTHSRLGFVTDIGHGKLDDGKHLKGFQRPDDAPLPKECPRCHFLRPSNVLVCPDCGFKPSRQSKVEVEDGDLVELASRGKAAKSKMSRADQQRWYSSFLHIAKSKSYKAGWAPHKFREKFGFWPDDNFIASSAEPGPDVLAYIRSTQIRYAKSKRWAVA